MATPTMRTLVEQIRAATLADSSGSSDTASRGNPYKLSDFDKLADIGSGTFGAVGLYRHRPTGTPCVIKSVNKMRTFSMRQQRSVLQERSALIELTDDKCPFAVQAYGTTQDDENLYFITEFVPGGEIYTFLKEYKSLTEDQARFYCGQLILALRHMHEKNNIAFRDIKPENVLLDRDGYIKLIDFGFAKKLEGRKKSDLTKTFSYVGTPEYMAPDALAKQGYTRAVDLWALGIFTYELLTGTTPFQGMNEEHLKERIMEAVLCLPDHFTTECRDFVCRLLERDPSKRLGCGEAGFQDIIDHPWFASLNWDDLLQKKLPAPFVPRVDNPYDATNYENTQRVGYVRRVSISLEMMNKFFADFNCRISEIPQNYVPSESVISLCATPRQLSTRTLRPESFQFDEWPQDGEMY